MIKKENITQSICFRNMLSQIPNISNSIASVLVEKYKNMENFIITMKNNGKNKSDIIQLIGNEKYGKNNRKIGYKTGEKIYLFIFDEHVNCEHLNSEHLNSEHLNSEHLNSEHVNTKQVNNVKTNKKKNYKKNITEISSDYLFSS
jgi:hypothetical protein